jgi:hypothetical protein
VVLAVRPHERSAAAAHAAATPKPAPKAPTSPPKRVSDLRNPFE